MRIYGDLKEVINIFSKVTNPYVSSYGEASIVLDSDLKLKRSINGSAYIDFTGGRSYGAPSSGWYAVNVWSQFSSYHFGNFVDVMFLLPIFFLSDQKIRIVRCAVSTTNQSMGTRFSNTYSFYVGIYTRTSNTLSTIFTISTTMSFSTTYSGSVHFTARWYININFTSNLSTQLSPGSYILGILNRRSLTTGSLYIYGREILGPPYTATFTDSKGSTYTYISFYNMSYDIENTTKFLWPSPFYGGSISTTSLPNTILLSNIQKSTFIPYVLVSYFHPDLLESSEFP